MTGRLTRHRALRLAWIGSWLIVAAVLLVRAAGEGPLWLARLDDQGITFAHPAWLWGASAALLVPILAAFGLTDLPLGQRGLQVLVRMALLVALSAAAAGPRTLRERPRRVQVVHLIDRSESVPDALLQAAARGAQASAQRQHDRERDLPPGETPAEPGPPPVTIVAFDAGTERLPWPPTATDDEAPLSLPALGRNPATAGETDLAGALNVALGMVGGDRVPHIVLWSDGIETRGDALHLAEPLRAAGVRVHTPSLPTLPPPAEVVVDRFELPPVVRANIPFPMAISLQATAPAKVRCNVVVPKQGPVAAQALPAVERTVPAGTTRLDLGELRLREPGATEVAVACQVLEGSDRFATNNQLRGRIVVQARPRVLYVEGAAGQSLYLTRALTDDFEVDVLPADGLPRTVGALRAYQAVVLSDVPRVSTTGVPLVTDGDMRNLHAYVQAGGGLLVLGGDNSLGSGGYQDTYLDKHVLPVRTEIESEIAAPSIALMLVIDKSGSMAGTKLELAKEAARATAESMAHEDRIGVVAFDSDPRLAVRLQRAGNRYRIASDIARLQPSGGTHIFPALELANQQLINVQAKIKHVIVMTDGQAPRAGIDALVRQMRRSGITVSSVGLGSDLDRNLLEAIADRGGGRAYFTDRAETLPRIFVKETKLLAGESVVEQRVHARRVHGLGRIDVLRNVAVEQAPVLTGFLPTKVRPGAEELLRLSTGAPLYVRWKIGDGKVAVWTSDLKNRWAAAWIDWPGYAILARQMVRDLLREHLGAEVAVRLLRERDQLRIAVDAMDDDATYMQGLAGEAKVRQPDGSEQTVPLPEVAPGRYEAVVPMRALGPYDVHAMLRAVADKPVLASGRATAVHPYPEEHRLPDAASSVLADLVHATGGQIDSHPDAWLDTAGATHRAHNWLWPDLVKLALLLLIVDVALRRVRLGRAPVTQWHAIRRSTRD